MRVGDMCKYSKYCTLHLDGVLDFSPKDCPLERSQDFLSSSHKSLHKELSLAILHLSLYTGGGGEVHWDLSVWNMCSLLSPFLIFFFLIFKTAQSKDILQTGVLF